MTSPLRAALGALLRSAAPVALAALVAAAPDAQILVYGGLARDRAAEPGAVYEEVVEVHNPSEAPQQARLYLTDYTFAADGSNAYGEPGQLERSNAGWISFAPSALTIPPGETAPVTVTVTVPAALDAEGSYWSMLMVEAIPEGSAESTLGEGGDEPLRLGVSERIRYGVQVATHVGAAAPDIAVVAADLADGERGKVLAADVENVGERLLVGAVYLDVFDAAGTAVGRIGGSTSRVYPGTSVRHRVDLSSLAPGVYEALLVIDGGDEGVFGAQYTLEL